jgi:hypothetical protein
MVGYVQHDQATDAQSQEDLVRHPIRATAHESTG